MHSPDRCIVNKETYAVAASIPSKYTVNTLVGNWYEERLDYKRSIKDHRSLYSDEYCLKTPTRYHPNVTWDTLFEHQGTEFISKNKYNDYPNYFENYTSTYDLSYNHYPKWYKDKEKVLIPRIWRWRFSRFEPLDDYLHPFHNLTKHGLVDHKRSIWDCESLEPRRTMTRKHREDYQPPKPGDFERCHHAIPKSNSSKLVEINKYAARLPFRGIPINVVPPTQDLIQKPRRSECNPITWECPDRLTNPNKCAEALKPPEPSPVTLLKCITDFDKSEGNQS